MPKSVSVTSEAAQQPPARAHFVKQTEERRGGDSDYCFTNTDTNYAALHHSTLIYTDIYYLHSSPRQEFPPLRMRRRGRGRKLVDVISDKYFPKKRTFQGYLPRTVNLLHFKEGGWSGQGWAGRRFHLVPIVKISSESYYPDFWLGLEPGPVCRYYRASSEGS